MIKVLKFGGTTLDSLEKRNKIIKIIKKELENKNKLLIVVSAIGRLNDNYSTDKLKTLVPYLKNKELDYFLQIGEMISTCVLSSNLNENKIRNYLLFNTNLKIITDNNYNNSNIIKIKIKNLKKIFKKENIIIIPGFIGQTKKKNITTLGRGGSDTTACILASKFKTELEIYQDVDGIYDEDPKLNPNSKLYKYITYNTILKLILNKAKFLHYKGFIIAKKNNLKIKFKNLNNNLETIINDYNEYYN